MSEYTMGTVRADGTGWSMTVEADDLDQAALMIWRARNPEGFIRLNRGELSDCHVTEDVRPVWSPPSASGEIAIRGFATFRIWWRNSDNVCAGYVVLPFEKKGT